MQAVGDAVEVLEAGRHADHLAVARPDRLDLVERALHDRREREVVLARAALGDVVDLGLGPVDRVVDVAVRGVPELGDAGAGLDETPQDGLLAHDVRVVAGVRRGRDRRDERVEVRSAADPGDLATAGQLGRNRDRIGRLAAAV